MSDIESIVREVDSFMVMERMPLHSEDKDRIRKKSDEFWQSGKNSRFSAGKAHCTDSAEENGMIRD